MNLLFYAKSLKGEVVKGAYVPAACSHTGKHYIVDTNKNYHEIDPESLGLKLPYRFIAEDRICSNAKVIMAKPNNNFDCITESPEKLAEFLGKCVDYPCGICTQDCPNDACLLDTKEKHKQEWMKWLEQKSEW